MKLIHACAIAVPCVVLFLACGDSVEDDDSDGPSSSNLEEACDKYCDAAYAAPCGELTISQCKAGCPSLEQQLGGVCVSEYTDLFDCASDLEFTCNNGQPTPNATGCAGEAQALANCSEDGECKKYCRALSDGGCADGSEEACVSTCISETETDCGGDLEDFYRCQTTFTSDPICEGGEPALSTECRRDYVEFVNCGAQGDACGTHCAMLAIDGCDASGCATDCAAKMDVSDPCFSDYRQLISCGDEVGWTCGASGPVAGEACMFEQERYDMCLAQNE